MEKLLLELGSDLQIYHDGSNSYIEESNATGNLFIKGTHIVLQNSSGQDALNLINGNAFLKSGGNTVLETTSTGIDVTGTVTADGVTVSGLSAISSATPLIQFIETDQSNKQYNIGCGGSGFFIRDESNSQFRYTIDTNGNHVFNEGSQDCDFRVESNGDTHALFVDGGNNRVGIGTASPDYPLTVRSMGSPSNDTFINIVGEATDANCGIQFTNSAGTLKGRLSYDTDDNNLQFVVNAAERMRIDSAGKVGIGAATNLSAGDSDNSIFQVGGSTHNVYAAHFYHTGDPSSSAPYGIQITYTAGSPDSNSDTANQFIRCNDSTTSRFSVAGDGDVTNHDNSYGQISDERIKQNITDASSQWNDIKAIKVRKFERKDDVIQHGAGERIQIGVVAQELETAGMNGLVNHSEPEAEHIKMSSEFGTLYTSDDAETKDGNDAVLYVADDQEVIDGNAEIGDIKTEATHSKKVGEVKTTTDEKVRSVKYSVLYMKAIKALQEAMTRIETLETKVTALEG